MPSQHRKAAPRIPAVHRIRIWVVAGDSTHMKEGTPYIPTQNKLPSYFIISQQIDQQRVKSTTPPHHNASKTHLNKSLSNTHETQIIKFWQNVCLNFETNHLTAFDKVPAVFGCYFPSHFLGISMELHATWCLPVWPWLFVAPIQ